MTDRQAEQVRKCVNDYLESEDGRGLDFGKAEDFEALVAHVRNCFLGVIDEDDLRMVTAMFWFGPGETTPPRPHRDALLETLRKAVSDPQARSDRVTEFVIAYGCGKWRQVKGGTDPWDRRWEGAVRGLGRALEPAVIEANGWLQRHVVDFPERSKLDLASDASLLAQKLIHTETPLHIAKGEVLGIFYDDDGARLELPERDEKPIPPGSKRVFTVVAADSDEVPLVLPLGAKVIISARDSEARIEVEMNHASQQIRIGDSDTATVKGPAKVAIWECSCGNINCADRHRLDSWKPDQTVQRAKGKIIEGAAKEVKEETMLTLWSFVASAVKGPNNKIQTGSFALGMYFALLAREGM